MCGHYDDPEYKALESHDAVPSQSTPASYSFPDDRLKQTMDDPERIPLLLVACGSFSPITYLHLRMFEMAADYVKFSTKFELIGGYLSPVSDAYRKAGLASARHRITMCQLGVDKTSNWLMVDPWEALQKQYSPTAKVLDHFDYEINIRRGGIDIGNGARRPVRIALLAGADLIHTMSTPGVWSEEDLDHILGRYGTFIVERSGTDIDEAIAGLQPWKDNIYVIQQLIQNDVSSTKIRLFLRREMSVRYLIPGPVINYIEKHQLYEEDNAASISSSTLDKGGDQDASKQQSKDKELSSN
ncbi:Nicotinamide/nicotinic acid mononucleotide adenylyltransferase 1 [Ophidiomyces ophidiicola]|nr:Nicotinamide/nicotinic acid mononucleotide adenylyltransferase 1 [Ophidiomyces ophidiicola]KAI1985286.1 Nicotinamide/nicotinic acid mononucleotide adenylyltransferase 1 [Ophidiomyces ophidiicola]KAI1991079.1 Nicotinamide/nicotinic acid mononucleotide adenylyltransferase 1 [Ophidiomyces ophidiicola]KAI1996260.1 Nicotinamide/nicotinic acid mononucleotide adenylyltransferase 1 [Ophidiomyces ophidiicola]